MTRHAILVACSLWMASCAPRVRITGPVGASFTASPGDRICIMTAVDAVDGTKVYAGSGEVVAFRIARALRDTYPDVLLLPTNREDEAEKDCRAEAGRYVLVPSILHWEDHATGWTGQADRIRVQVALRDLAPAASTRHLIFEAHTNTGIGGLLRAGVSEWGNKPPRRLLDSRFDRAIITLLSSQEGGVP